MINKMEIASMVFEGVSRSISVAPKYCSKIKHKSAPCTICYTLCPVQAIHVGGPGETITVEWETCTGCGMCVSQCHSQVYKLRHGGYSKFIDKLTSHISPKGELVISCSENHVYNRNVAVVECAGIFNVVDILVLYLRGASKITIKYGICSECQSKHGSKVLEQEIKHLQLLSTIFSDLKDMEIIFESDSVRLIFPIQHEVYEIIEEEKPNPTVNRRGMFSFFKETLRESLLKSADMVTVETLEPRTQIDFTHEETARRKQFLECIMSLGNIMKEEVETGMLFNNIEIDESCVYCGMCARFCNTGALAINEDRTEITFNPSKCISCGMCEKSCFHAKLHYKETLSLRLFFKDNIIASRDKSRFTVADMKVFHE